MTTAFPRPDHPMDGNVHPGCECATCTAGRTEARRIAATVVARVQEVLDNPTPARVERLDHALNDIAAEYHKLAHGPLFSFAECQHHLCSEARRHRE